MPGTSSAALCAVKTAAVSNGVHFLTQGPKKRRRQKLEEKAGKTMSCNAPEIPLVSTSIYFMVTFLFF